MKIHKDVEYALISMSAMAKEGRKLSARVIADRYNIPYKLLTRILRQLTAAGILESIQGPRGGYRLSLPPRAVTLGAVMEAVHGAETVASCIGSGTECEQAEGCTIRGGIRQVQDMWSGFVNTMSLADFLGGVAAESIESR